MNASHWNNGRFYNPNATAPLRSFRDLLHWLCHRQSSPWPKWIPSSPGSKPPERVRVGELRVTSVGHATVLVQIEGKNFLTDPIWSHRASPFSWIGPKRHRAPGLRFEDIPPIDAILLSHDHYDHMDTPTLLRLRAAHQPRILCSLGVGRRLQKLGFDAPDELDWWQSLEFAPGLRIHCTPAQHFSGRTPWDRNRTLWCSWLIESRHGNVYFAGDTGLGPHFGEIARRYPPPRLALLPIGAFRPEWLMSPVHMSPDHALRAHRILGASTSAAIHYGTFRLADDGQAEAVDRLRALVAHSSMPEDFRILEEGIGYDIFPNEQCYCAQETMTQLPRRAGDEETI